MHKNPLPIHSKALHATNILVLEGNPLRSAFVCKGLHCLFFLLVCFALGGIFGCERVTKEETDFVLAEQAYELKEIADAQMYYERFLRKNQIHPKRWYVWQQLFDIALHFRQEKIIARSYLELMLVEFDEDVSRKLTIQTLLADLAAELKDYRRAIVLWEELVASEVTPVDAKATIYRKLSAAYLRRLEFSAATDGLKLCLDLPLQTEQKADCLYDLAITQTLIDAFPEAKKSFEALISMAGVSPERLVMATFLLADVYEQEEQYEKAKELYESIRNSYPNMQVVLMRLANIEKKMKK